MVKTNFINEKKKNNNFTLNFINLLKDFSFTSFN